MGFALFLIVVILSTFILLRHKNSIEEEREEREWRRIKNNLDKLDEDWYSNWKDK